MFCVLHERSNHAQDQDGATTHETEGSVMNRHHRAGDEILEVERYWNERPCNIRHSTSPVGSRQYFQEVEARKYMIEPHIPGFAQFEQWNNCTVLEVGCGLGTDTVNFARDGACITAIDLADSAVALTRARVNLEGLRDRVWVLKQNVEELDLTTKFDLIYAWGSLHHTPNPKAALSRLREHAHPNTIIKVMVYHRWSTKAIGLALRGRYVSDWSEAQFGCPVTYIFSRREARRWFHNSGFEITSMKVAHVFPWRIPDYTEYRYIKRWYYRHWPTWAWNLLESTLGWHLMIEGRAV